MPRNPEMNSSDQDRDLRVIREGGEKDVVGCRYDRYEEEKEEEEERAQPTGEVSIAEEAVWRPRGEYKISRVEGCRVSRSDGSLNGLWLRYRFHRDRSNGSGRILTSATRVAFVIFLFFSFVFCAFSFPSPDFANRISRNYRLEVFFFENIEFVSRKISFYSL